MSTRQHFLGSPLSLGEGVWGRGQQDTFQSQQDTICLKAPSPSERGLGGEDNKTSFKINKTPFALKPPRLRKRGLGERTTRHLSKSTRHHLP